MQRVLRRLGRVVRSGCRSACCDGTANTYVRVLSCCFPGQEYWIPTSSECLDGRPVWTQGGPPVFFARTDFATGLVFCSYTDPTDVRTLEQIQKADPDAVVLIPDGPLVCSNATSCSDNPPCDPCPTCCFYDYLAADECAGPECCECGREYSFEFSGQAQVNERIRFVGFLSVSGVPRPEPCGIPDCIDQNTSIYHHVSGLESTIVYGHELRFKVRCYCDEFGQKTCECVSYNQSKYFEVADFSDRWDGNGCPPPKGDPPILQGRTIVSNFQTNECPPSGIARDWCGFSEQDGKALLLDFPLRIIGEIGCDDCTPCNGNNSYSFFEDEGNVLCPVGFKDVAQFSYNGFNTCSAGSYTYTGNRVEGRKFADRRIYDEYVAFNWTVTPTQPCSSGQGCDGPLPAKAKNQLVTSLDQNFLTVAKAMLEAS